MKEQKPRGVRALLPLVPLYCAGVLIGLCFLALKMLGIWKVNGMEHFPKLAEKRDRPLMLVSNHPSLLDPLALLGLFTPWYVLTLEHGPWNMADTTNYRRGLFRLMEPCIIFVDRKSVPSRYSAFRRAARLLLSGAILIIFPEGGRTSSAADGNGLIIGKNGAKIRPFQDGAGFLAVKTQAIVVPVWISGTDRVSPNRDAVRYPFPRFWRPVTFNIGRSVVFPKNVSAEQATRELERAVLELA